MSNDKIVIENFENISKRQAELARESRDQLAMLNALGFRHTSEIAQGHWHELQKHWAAFGKLAPSLAVPGQVEFLQEYLRDFFERYVLFVDALRETGNNYLKRQEEGFKPVLMFDYDIAVSGRDLERPVNYTLVRIRPPEGYPEQREDGRPFVIIDPRAGHGSGIGGFKSESEVGVALKDGHPVYYVIFDPDPEPEQTLADVCTAEALFLEEVQRRHPTAPRPLVTGNCQGGWATMLLAATHPGLTGPLVIAGAPLSYWAGELGKNPLRYLGGLVGGAVPALLMADLEGGKFDGANLVLNFEHLNPANTWWRKYYDVFANVDEQSERFIDFEKWWSGFYFMNENEIRWIVETLFIGNKLTQGKAILPDGTPVDLTRIKAPIIVFASHGDNITPPQQALNWIPDLYETAEEIKARGQVIIYTLHDSVGHLGIFVSAKVAEKQHKQITSVVKTIEALAPGLYEMVIDKEDGDYHVSFESRTINDVLALGGNRAEEDEFSAVARLSEWGTQTYELTVRPYLKALVTPAFADAVREFHPMRQRRVMFSDMNPLLTAIDPYVEDARSDRHRARDENPYKRLEHLQADMIEQSWNFYRDMRDAMVEMTFHGLYGTAAAKSLDLGHKNSVVSHDIKKFPEVKQAIAKAEQGGYPEAIIRMLVLLAKARGSVRRDRLERSNKILHSRAPFDTMNTEQRGHMIHEQTMIVEFAPEEALASLPKLLKDDVDRVRAINLVFDVAGPADDMDANTISKFKQIQYVLRTMAKDWHEPENTVLAHDTAPPNADTAKGKKKTPPGANKGAVAATAKRSVNTAQDIENYSPAGNLNGR